MNAAALGALMMATFLGCATSSKPRGIGRYWMDLKTPGCEIVDRDWGPGFPEVVNQQDCFRVLSVYLPHCGAADLVNTECIRPSYLAEQSCSDKACGVYIDNYWAEKVERSGVAPP